MKHTWPARSVELIIPAAGCVYSIKHCVERVVTTHPVVTIPIRLSCLTQERLCFIRIPE